jgi:hypothetical protein
MTLPVAETAVSHHEFPEVCGPVDLVEATGTPAQHLAGLRCLSHAQKDQKKVVSDIHESDEEDLKGNSSGIILEEEHEGEEDFIPIHD